MKEKLYVESLLLKRNVEDLRDLALNPEEYYISIQDNQEDAINLLKSLKELRDEKALFYVDGVIFIKLGWKVIIPYGFWDEISSLWPYLINLIEDYQIEGKAECSFPNQPITLEITKLDSRFLLFSVDDNKIKIDEQYFISTLLTAAEEYFTFLHKAIGEFDSFEINRINKLKAHIT